ncbi:MAG: mercury(II) reductase [Parcubacteria group bacterium]|nr:mercury(II) reductase [Parcubacteria group bacterium]
MTNFDLIIIGGGAGAFAGAIRANELKAKTAIINAGLPLGGTCVNVGCVPSKTLLWAGEIMHLVKHHNIPGLLIEIKDFNFLRVIQDELALVEKLRKEKYANVLKNLEYVTYIEGYAKFVSQNEIEVNGQKLRGEKFIIATGSTTNVPVIEGIREVGFITHIEALKLEKQPKDLIVIGAGPLGLEFGQMFSRFGSRVTILQRGSSIFPPAEKVLTSRLQEVLEKEGIAIKINVEVKSARKENDKKILAYTIEGKTEEIAADEILLAAGKTANTDGLELEKAGVDVDTKKAIAVNEYFQTSSPHIFAVGDVTNLPLRLEPTAGHEGTLAAEDALTGLQKSIDYRTVPWTVFTDPQLAGVGYTEEEQLKEIGVCACRTVSFQDVPKAMIMRRTEGLIKMVIQPKTKQIMGVQILAPHAGELIAEAMILVKNKNTIDEVIESLPMFPTLSEAIKLVALSFTRDISKLSCCI